MRCGYISVIGRPNAGKSSLLNWLLGEKIAMVSHKANATRKRLNLIVMHEENQLIFIDTPGLHKTEKLLNQYMLDEALKAMGDCDVILFLAPITDGIEHYVDFLQRYNPSIKHILLLTKIDHVSPQRVLEKIKAYEPYESHYEALIPISIKRSTKQEDVLDVITGMLPEHPYLYDTEILTPEHLRTIFKELIRESIFENLSEEIPYETDVIIDSIKEKEDIDVIKATIVVEKKSQKGMLIGKGAATIKRIGRLARQTIESLTQKKAYLELFVSVKPGWTKSKEGLKSLGYEIE